MKLGDKRMTEKEIEKMIELRKRGKGYAEIGREMNPPRHHTTILFQLRKHPIPIPELVGVKSKSCVLCGKIRAGKWEDTNYCSADCWDTDYYDSHPKYHYY